MLSMRDCGIEDGDYVKIERTGHTCELFRRSTAEEPYSSLGHIDIHAGRFTDGPFAGQAIGFISGLPLPIDGNVVIGFGSKMPAMDTLDDWGFDDVIR